MSIVVKGAKLPNNCGACPLRLAWCTERLYMVTRPERCPLEPERTGKWTYVTDGYVDYFRCDRCGKPVFADTPYCPNCGARMEDNK